ncbi:MAG: hypothetical protein IT487_11255 [Chromatiaceae bacterium]|nr:hypothetical protein [Chromatiaceae bacterium]
MDQARICAWIIRQLPGRWGLKRDDRINELLGVRAVGEVLRRLEERNRGAPWLSTYNAYLALLTIQQLLEQCELA